MLLKEIFLEIKAFVKASPLPKLFMKKTLAMQKKLNEIFSQFWNRTLKKLVKSLKKNKKSKKNEKDLELLEEIALGESFAKKNKAIEGEEFSKNVNQIGKLLQNYEELIQKDFFMIIREANATLRSWKANLVRMLAAHSITNEYGVENLSANLQEMTELYQHSELMLESFTQHCVEYQEIVKDAKRIISPQQKLNQVQSQLERMKRGLQKGKELTDLEHNQDYTYLARYVREKSQGMSLTL